MYSSIIEKSSKSTNKSLIIVPGYGRNLEYYKNLSLKILENSDFQRIIGLNLHGHEGGKNVIDFDKSVNRVSEIIEKTRERFGGTNILWGHSYGALVSSFVGSKIGINNGVNHLILSSLPWSMTNRKYVNWIKKNGEI